MKSKEKMQSKTNLLKKCTISGDIPTNVLKQHIQIDFKNLTDILNESIKMDKFPDILKSAEVTPVYKKDDMNDKQNYPPLSKLSNLSNVFENFIYSQINTSMSDKFYRYLTDITRTIMHSLNFYDWNMTENWKLI